MPVKTKSGRKAAKRVAKPPASMTKAEALEALAGQPDCMTLAQVSDFLGFSYTWVKRRVDSGALRTMKSTGSRERRKHRVTKNVLAQFLVDLSRGT